MIIGLFLPWVHWEVYTTTDIGTRKLCKGSELGLGTMDESIDAWFFLFFGFLGCYLSLRKKGSLSSIFVMIFGFLVVASVSLGIFAPWAYVPPKFSDLESLPDLTDAGVGLYVELAGGIVILGTGIFSLVQKWRIGREASGPPPY